MNAAGQLYRGTLIGLDGQARPVEVRSNRGDFSALQPLMLAQAKPGERVWGMIFRMDDAIGAARAAEHLDQREIDRRDT